MKKIALLIALALCLSLSTSATQNGEPGAKKKAVKPAVDCSTMKDTTLAATVKEKLANTPSLKDFLINVVAKDGTV